MCYLAFGIVIFHTPKMNKPHSLDLTTAFSECRKLGWVGVGLPFFAMKKVKTLIGIDENTL
jgi:hypothetical protein